MPDFVSRLTTIIDVTEASAYHGFLPVLVRSCIASLTGSPGCESGRFPLPFATALFSFLYHLASYEAGGEALVSAGMMEGLLQVVHWQGSDPEQITVSPVFWLEQKSHLTSRHGSSSVPYMDMISFQFVTRAVRVIDLITNLDMQSFQTHQGLSTFINRLEVSCCVLCESCNT